ncbi:hypothetical protein E2320_013482 [Naja naja]|nr:hypothetical protein E2320_013482 [Naja naja]
MTCSPNVVFLLDTADSAEKGHLHLGALRILNFLGCKFGLAKVRWDFKFFDSRGIRGRASRVGSFRELGSRSWEDFEEELEARFGKQLYPPGSPGPTARSTVTRNILKETLLDYQWDRPEIVSPTKPVLRSQKNKLMAIVDNPPAQSTHAGFANAIFILSPCPHSRRELWQFISGSNTPLPEELPPSHDLAEKFLPKGIQDMMVREEEARSCAVVLEPLTLNQRQFEGTVKIHLKCTMTDWKSAHVRNLHTESWTLQSKPLGPSAQEISWFQQFVKYILAQGLHVVAEVTFSSGAHSPCTGVFSPISGTTALLSLLFAEQVAEAERSLLQAPVAENFSKEEDFCLPEVVSSVLSQVMEDSEEDHQPSPESLCPGWAQQELSRVQNWSPAVLEDWYSVSNLCGASSHMMESFRMLQASSTKNEEETSKSEVELRQSLAEFYQKINSERGVPRTPIRQKMKTMPRSLQMLNAAMFNVKAQKHQPGGELPAHKKPRQRLFSRRLDGKGEGNGRKQKSKIDFSTEDEMLSYLNTNYQNAMMDGENLLTCSQDMVTAVNTFQKSSESACLDTIQRSLLKTTNTLRQQLATDPDKETRIKEYEAWCRLQVYLRLEICLQRPLLQNNPDRMGQLVQEVKKHPLARHRSITEMSQNLRQIEIPQASWNHRRKNPLEKVTKVRRNLFNEETLSLGKSSLPKMARSQSVSILEDLKHKRSRSKEDIRAHRKLLTKTVAETPLHKQMSKRLLQRQITGRCSDPGSDVGIVEESPEKTITCGLRRSPRIKQLMQDKFLSSNIHSLEPNKRNTPQVQSVHLEEPERTPGKSSFQSSQELLNPKGSMLRRSPRIQERQTPQKTPRQTPRKTPALKNSVAKCLGNLFSPPRQKSKSLPTSTESQESRLPWVVEKKDGHPSSPKAAELQTPEKPPLSDMLDDVFALPADGPDSPIILSPSSSPFALQWKSCSELQSPRSSLRIAPQIMPTVLAENRTFEIRRNTCPEPISSVNFPSLLPSPAAFKDTHPELGLTHIQNSPNIRTVSESVSEIRSTFQFSGISPSCNGSAKAGSPCMLSPTREKLGRNSCSPQETQSIRKTSPVTALGSPPSLSREEHPSMDIGRLVAETSPFIKPEENASLGQRPEQITKIISPSKRKGLERCLSPTFSSNNSMRFAHAVVLCEKLDPNKPLSDDSRVDPGSKSSISSTDDAADGQRPPRQDWDSPLAISKPRSGTYALRCTADRRQREAAARLEKEEKMATSKTFEAKARPLTYEVELEMQASGLPKLRIRKVASKAAQQPLDLCDKLKGEENDHPVGDISVAWCSRHPEKLEPVSISPSCNRSAHNTPGKFGVGGQTYICHSYSPTLCTLSTTSPSQGSTGIPWTPSPKHNGKVTPEAIKDWPRRKRATVGYSRSERLAEAVGEEPAPPPGGQEPLELFSSRKVQLLGDPELEGIDKLQDQSLGSDTEGNKDENIYRNTLVLESRKRAQEQRTLGEEASQETKRPCLIKENPGAAVYSTEQLSTGQQTFEPPVFPTPDMTPPKSSGNGVISASGEDPDTFGAAYEDFSLFRSTPARKRSIIRTYSRKRPLC